MEHSIWIEKYRPKSFEEIKGQIEIIKRIKALVEKQNLPHLLFTGPAGVGKTTLAVVIAKQLFKDTWRENFLELNASDERGIDIIRNQINTFVNSKSLFNDGMKFVILDEVDYMTKNAQIALRYLLQDYKSNVRFCLICNYISRIDEALQNEFVRLRFNQLPENEIIHFLNIINEKEKLNYNTDTIQLIQKLFNSDIRSMINYMQSNEQIIHNKKIIQTDLWDNITTNMKERSLKYNIEFITNVSNEYNVEKKNIIKNYLNYIIRYNKELLSFEFLQFVENIMHVTELNIEYMLPLTILKMKTFLTN